MLCSSGEADGAGWRPSLPRLHLAVRVVLQPSAPSDLPALIEAGLHERLELAGALPPPIDVVHVEAIAREAGHSANLKPVKNLTHTSR